MNLYKFIKRLMYITIFACVPLTSCDDFIDLEPTNVLAANLAFQSIEDVESALLGTYASLRTSYARIYTTLPDIIADNATLTTENLGQEVFLHGFQYTANQGEFSTAWANNYRMIERANVVLVEVENFEASEQQKNSIRGQALALRALGHFDLLRYFSDRYSATPGATHAGVPIKLTPGQLTTPSRNTVAEVYDQVFDDLLTAKLLLSGIPQPSKHRFGDLAVTALLARVSLYAERWQDAVNFATEVINVTSLATQGQFVTMWSEDTEDEVIFSVPFNQGEGNIGSVLYQANAQRIEGADRLQWAPAEELLALYDRINDVRFISYFQNRPQGNTSQIVDNKYRGRGSTGGAIPPILELNDAKMLRVGEQYLIRAEANNNLGNESAAMSDINTLRRARISNYVNVSLSGAALTNAIAVERRKELAFEGHRWFDLKRQNLPVDRGSDCDASPAVACSLDANNFRVVWAIPQDEIFANDNIEQNPGY